MNMLSNFAEWLYKKSSRMLSDEYLDARLSDTCKLIKAGYEATDGVGNYALDSNASDWAAHTNNEYDRIMIERLRQLQSRARIHARVMRLCADGWKDNVGVSVTGQQMLNQTSNLYFQNKLDALAQQHQYLGKFGN